MSKYTFTFKKDDIFVEFFTEDKDVVERQFQIWVSDADDYVNNRPFKQTVITKAAPVNEETENREQETVEIVSETPIAIEETEKVVAESPEVSEIPAEIKQDIEQEIEQPEVFDKASSLLKTINEIQSAGVTDGISIEEKLAETVDFESVLEQSIENPTFEPAKVQDQVFLNLIKSKNTKDKFHYLIITAYYLSEFEKMERFSLKQLNSKLMYNLSEVIDHATLQDAINQKFIELVPDLTGISEVAEYKLTRLGEEFFSNKM